MNSGYLNLASFRSWRLRAVLMVSLALLAPVPEAAVALCTGGSTAAAAIGPVTYLRSYRDGFRSPVRLTVDPAGSVFVVDSGNGRLVARRADGSRVFDLRNLGTPVSVAIGADGIVYVGDRETGRVDAYDAGGTYLFPLGQGDGEFAMPNDLAVDPASGDVFVADSGANAIKRYSASGQFLSSFDGAGSAGGQFDFPAALAVRDGEVFVVDRRNARIQVFDVAGGFKFCIDSVTQRSVGWFSFCGGWWCGTDRFYDQGIWVDGQGRIYVVDSFEGSVYVMGRDGGVVSSVGGFDSGAGRLRTPTDVVVDPHGRVFVASNAGSSVEMFGVGTYSDPEAYVPGRLEVTPDPLDRDTAAGLSALLEVPGYPLSALDETTLVANGVSVPVALVPGDHDNDAEPDVLLEFGPDLVATLPFNGDTAITLTGEIAGMLFEESDIIRVVSVAGPDSDGDGVPDQGDACPGTGIGLFVTPDGCDVFQQCPCDLERTGSSDGGKTGGKGASARGHYMQCATRVANLLVELSAITPKEKGQLLRDVAKAECHAENE